MADKEAILKRASMPIVKIAGGLFCVLLVAVLFITSDRISFIRTMLTGTNSYEALGDYADYGIAIRTAAYIISTVFSVIILAVVPTRRLFCTIYGTRTLSIYFLGMILYYIAASYFPHLRIWQYFLLSILMIPILGNKKLNQLLGKLLKL